jgi:acyl-CoA synthetase (NDP forming)
MNLPIYQIINVKSAQLEDIAAILHEDLNLRRPVAYVLKTLNLDEQREVIGVIENWFETHQASWRYPYPVFIISDYSDAIGHMPVFTDVTHLPRFYNQKDVKVTVKETQVLERNRLLQQEIKNADSHEMAEVIKEYGINHKKIWYLVKEASFYEQLLKKLRAKVNG